MDESAPARSHIVTRRSVAIVVPVMMVVMMVVMVVVIPAARRYHIDARAIAVAPAVMMVMMVVVMMVIPLRHLHIALARSGRRLFIERLQDLRGIRNRLQQLRIGVGLQRIRRAWCGGR